MGTFLLANKQQPCEKNQEKDNKVKGCSHNPGNRQQISFCGQRGGACGFSPTDQPGNEVKGSKYYRESHF